MLDLIVEFFPWDWKMQEKIKFVFNYVRAGAHPGQSYK